MNKSNLYDQANEAKNHAAKYAIIIYHHFRKKKSMKKSIKESLKKEVQKSVKKPFSWMNQPIIPWWMTPMKN